MPKATQTGSRSFYWVGTWNHAGDREAFIDINAKRLEDCSWFKGIWASQERGDSGTLHIQFYVECKRRYFLSELREQFPEVHWEIRKGNAKQARDYCLGKTKTGGPKPGWEKILIRRGEESSEGGQGKRTDIESMRDMLVASEVTTVAEAMEHCTSMASLSFAKEWLSAHAPPMREQPPKVFWFYGSTGSGKTRAVYDFCAASALPLWRMPSSGSYFQGYIGQDVALFDDFREGRLPFTELLELTDRYNPVANVKYGQCWFTPRWIIFTAAKSIRDTFTATTEDVGQLLRRISQGGGAQLDFNEDGGREWKERIDVFINTNLQAAIPLEGESELEQPPRAAVADV